MRNENYLHENPISTDERTHKRVLNEAEAAEYIGMSISFLRNDRVNGTRKNHTPGPKFFRIGKSVRYMRDDLENWLTLHQGKTKYYHDSSE